MKIKLFTFAAALGILFSGCREKIPELHPTADNPVTISLWYDATVTEAGAPPADWIAYKIIREKFGINLELTMLPFNQADKNIKVNAAADGGTLPDMVVVNREPLLNLIQKDLIMPVDELYPLMPNRTQKMYDESSRNFATVKGKCYGFSTPGGKIQKNEGVLIRKDWLENLGLSIPKTIDEYLDVMRAFTHNDPDKNGKNDTYGYGAFIEINSYEEGLGRRLDPIFGAFGVAGTWNMTEKDAGLNVRKPTYFDALSTIVTMQNEGLIDPNWLGYKKDDFRAAWKQGRFGIMREQHSAYASESNYAPFDRKFPNGSWIVIDPPVGPNGESAVGVNTIPYTTLVISKKAQKEGKAPLIAALLEWMVSDEGYYLLGWGQEGVNFVFNENHVPVTEGIPDPSKGYTKAAQQPLTQLRNMVFWHSDAELISRYPTYTTEVSHKTMSALTVLREMQQKAWANATGSDSMPLPSTELKHFYEQGVLDFVTGKRVLTKENWALWLEEFDRLGGKRWEEDGVEKARQANYLY
ncbi:extracellular solute-binding protein [Treponema sp. UBA3813]|uniref:extracellular solute-binding protein n=1 Tax=Treponema sp. UBA3813 TaxID=1947715 RepID=UPI0025D347C9|nr:extracellular solute-binding protein [Treponema sp. UBA3813]